MTDEYSTQVTEILDEASGKSGKFLSPEAAADDAGHDFIEIAREADELVASSEPMELLEAVGLGTLSDGSEAGSVSEAITRGDPERVEDLYRLLRLAKLGDRSDEETLEKATGGIREAVGQAQSETGETVTEGTDQGNTPDQGEAEQESTVNDENETEAEEGDSEDADDLGNRLHTAMSSSFEKFSDEISGIQEQLEEPTAGDEADTDEAEEIDDDDEGLLGLGGGGSDDDSGGLGSSSSSHYSTMAPPPSERADMHAVKRYSTMPKRNK